MKLFALSGILTSISSLLFGLFVLLKNIKNRVYQLWFVFNLSVAVWGFGIYQISSAAEKMDAFFWWRVAHIGVIFIPVFFAHFVYKWLKIKERGFIYFSYLCGLFFLFINIYDLLYYSTDLFIANVRWVFDSVYYVSLPGPIYGVFTVWWFSLVVYLFYKLLKVYKGSSGVKRSQIQYFLFASIVGYVGGATVFLPIFGIDVYPYLSFVVPFYPFIITYVMLRHRLMDIRLVIRKSIVACFLTLFSYFFFYIIAFFFYFTWGDVFAREGYVAGFLIAFLFALFFIKIHDFANIFTKSYFYVGVNKIQKALEELSKKIITIVKIDELIDLIVSTIKDTLEINNAGIILYDYKKQKYKTAKVIGFDFEKKIEDKDNLLVKWLKKTDSPLVFNELSFIIREVTDIKQKKNFKKLRNNIKKIGAELFLPLKMHDKLIGVIILGKKNNNAAYYKEDIELLTLVSNQAAVAIANAQLYNETEKIIKDQTEELRIKNENLQELLEAKSDFLSIASHQLRTPVSIIKGMLSMLADHSVPEEKREKFIQRTVVNTERLCNTVHDLLSASALEGKEFKIFRQPTKIEQLITGVVKERRSRVQAKKIKLIYTKPKKTLPVINVDENKIIEVIANLIDNAIQYTKKGKIELSTQVENSNIVIKISDTGIGISKKDIPKLFKKISRLVNAVSIRPDGTGLGLFIVKHIVEAHGGNVSVQSEGIEGKGSTFTVTLPLVQK